MKKTYNQLLKSAQKNNGQFVVHRTPHYLSGNKTPKNDITVKATKENVILEIELQLEWLNSAINAYAGYYSFDNQKVIDLKDEKSKFTVLLNDVKVNNIEHIKFMYTTIMSDESKINYSTLSYVIAAYLNYITDDIYTTKFEHRVIGLGKLKFNQTNKQIKVNKTIKTQFIKYYNLDITKNEDYNLYMQFCQDYLRGQIGETIELHNFIEFDQMVALEADETNQEYLDLIVNYADKAKDLLNEALYSLN